MASHARDAGLENIVIINTCAVTQKAISRSHAAVRRARRNHPEAQIIVTGCAAQLAPDTFAAMPESNIVLGNHEKMQAASFIPERLFKQPAIQVSDIMQSHNLTLPPPAGHNRINEKSQDRTRAFLQVQNGCNHRCTFCTIPYGRGQSRSVAAGEIVAQVRALVAQGHKEVVLTGVDLSSWGQDLPTAPPLGNLVQRILKLVPELPRLRLSSLDPAHIDESLLTAFAHSRLMPHVHLSIQSGDNLILKRMKRRHNRADILNLCTHLRSIRPDISFGADFIVGFPTESETMFMNSVTLLEEAHIAWTHVFAFSPHKQTPAAHMPQVPTVHIHERVTRLRACAQKQRQAYLKTRQNQHDTALFEKDGLGRLPDFTRVRITHPPDAGQFAQIYINGYDDLHCLGYKSHDR